IIRDLPIRTYHPIVRINLLTQAIHIPEVSLLVILHPHNQPFLPSHTSLIQTIAPTPPNDKREVIIYPDKITDSIQYPI
ncbi:P-loop NTPase family protein, partial [Staphylococcus epidermidis]